MTDSRIIVACEAYRLEVEASLADSPLAGVPVRTFAAECHRTAVLPRSLVEQARQGGATLHVFGGPCVMGLGESARADGSLEGCACSIHAEKQCFHLLAAEPLVDALQAEGAFVATPGWLSRWRDHLADLGLDGGLAAELFAEGADKVVLLDTGLRSGAWAALAEMASTLGLATGTLPLSLTRLRDKLVRGVEGWPPDAGSPASPADRLLAEYAMALDLLGDLDQLDDRDAILARVAEVCGLLLSPRTIACWAIDGDGGHRLVTRSPDEETEPLLPDWPTEAGGHATPDGVVVPIRHQGTLLGVLSAEGVLLPDHLRDYLHITRFIARLAGIALHDLDVGLRRAGSGDAPLVTLCSFCKSVRHEGAWQRIEAWLVSRLPVLFSHGICPGCFQKQFGDLDEE